MSLDVETDLLVIGAGAAGIGAACEMEHRSGNYLVIEADQRVGGRARTDTKSLGMPFDLGASFIHGADAGNPWADIALALRADIVRDRQRRLALTRHVASAGEAATGYLQQREVAFSIMEQHSHLGTAPERFDLGLTGAWAGPAAMAVGPWLAGCDPHRLDPQDWCEAIQGEDWLIAQGYGALVARFASFMQPSLDTQAQRIEVTPTHVAVTTNRGTIRARHVILTCSTGVLRAERIAFSPRLPNWVQDAIDGLPMGNLTKVGLQIVGDHPAFSSSHYLHIDRTCPTLPLYFVRPGGAACIMAFMGGSAVNDLLARRQTPGAGDLLAQSDVGRKRRLRRPQRRPSSRDRRRTRTAL